MSEKLYGWDSTMNDFAAMCHREAKANGWHNSNDGDPAEPKRIGTMLLLVVSELTEAFEEIRRHGKGNEPAENSHYAKFTYFGENGKPEGFPIEIADAFIRLGDMAAALGLDMDAAIAAKLNYNRTRGYRHGGKAA